MTIHRPIPGAPPRPATPDPAISRSTAPALCTLPAIPAQANTSPTTASRVSDENAYARHASVPAKILRPSDASAPGIIDMDIIVETNAVRLLPPRAFANDNRPVCSYPWTTHTPASAICIRDERLDDFVEWLCLVPAP